MKKAFHLLLGLLLAGSIYSCSDDTANSIGTSITDTKLEIVSDSSFTVEGTSVRNEKILTRTMTQLLGSIKAKNFGELRSDFVCQFLPSNALDTTGITADMIDSVRLIMRIPKGGLIGDSLMPMRVNVYELNKQLPTQINSTFNPEGYYNENDMLCSGSYISTITSSPNLIQESMNKVYYRTIVMTLPKKLAVEMFKEYQSNPGTFQSVTAFNKFFKGIYASNSYGSGRIMKIDKTFMLVNYRYKTTDKDGNDTIQRDSTSYATAAPEVITNNNISLEIDENIINRVNAGEAIVQAPIGYDVNVKFPVKDIINKFNSSLATTDKYNGKDLGVINSLYFELPIEEIENDYGIAPPTCLLLIKSSEKDNFFAKNKIADNDKTFYAVYNTETKSYSFGNMRNYIIDVLDADEEELEDAENMVLVPVDVMSETNSNNYYYYTGTSTTTVTSMTPAVSGPMIGKLKFDEAKIKFVFTKQANNK